MADMKPPRDSYLIGVQVQQGDSLETLHQRLVEGLNTAVRQGGMPSYIGGPILDSAQRPQSRGGVSLLDAREWAEVLGQPSCAAPEPGAQTDTAVADDPLFQGYSFEVTTHRAPGVPSCDLCGSPIAPGMFYRKVRVGCQRYRVHWNCLSRAQEQIATALESSDPAIEDEPEEDAYGDR